jgi:glycosyltransferase involved in cell wall biosynthesis
MTTNPLVSIIVRTKNEERWITQCLDSVYRQNYEEFEVILVDNDSTDDTLRRASLFPVKVVSISNYLPGLALNQGIRSSSGEIIVCLSAHCVPLDEDWLENLVSPLSAANIAGVYGKQEPVQFSSDEDKRDLITVFGLDEKLQIKDPFFHNANSALLRSTWNRFPFDESVSNLEDRVWGQRMIDAGKQLLYTPLAKVSHWHGIHQGMNPTRTRGVLRVIESLGHDKTDFQSSDPNNLNICSIIPIRSSSISTSSHYLLRLAIEASLSSEFVNRTIVATDDLEIADLAKAFGAEVPFMRPMSLSDTNVDVMEVIRFSLESLESEGSVLDLIVLLEATYPFRSRTLIDDMINKLLTEGLDTVMAGKPEERTIWTKNHHELNPVVEPFVPRNTRLSKGVVGLLGLGLVTRPVAIRQNSVLIENVGVSEIVDQLSSIEIRTDEQAISFKPIINFWRTSNELPSVD